MKLNDEDLAHILAASFAKITRHLLSDRTDREAFEVFTRSIEIASKCVKETNVAFGWSGEGGAASTFDA
jgi:hypothetical protein